MKNVLIFLFLGTTTEFFAKCENEGPCCWFGTRYEKEVSQGVEDLKATDAALYTDIENLKRIFKSTNGNWQKAYNDLKTTIAAQDAVYGEFQTSIGNLKDTVVANEDASLELQKNIENLTEAVADESIYDLQKFVDDLNMTVSATSESINTIEKNIEDLKTSAARDASVSGATYTRWGKTECPSVNGTVKIYDGLAAGGTYTRYGGAIDLLCIPREPSYGNYSGSLGGSSYLYAAAYTLRTEASFALFGKDLKNPELNTPCVVCQSIGRTASLRIAGQTDCYTGWTTEYRGYLLSEHEGHQRAPDFPCVDSDADGILQANVGIERGRLLYKVTVHCFSNVPWCPPYINARELACVMCTK